MKILHLSSDFKLIETIERIVEANNGKYINCGKEDIQMIISGEIEFNVLVIDNDKFEDKCEQNIAQMINNSVLPISVIIISDNCDFRMRTTLFDLGIMTIIGKANFDDNRFSKYLETVRHELMMIETLKNMSIAVVDDSRFSLEVIKGYFEKYKLTNVHYFQNSSSFITQSFTYDLFLIDLVMPEYDGEELIYRIRESNHEAMIILITTYGEGKAINHCLSIGANDFILKPLDYKLFMLRVMACISHQQLNIKIQKNTELLYDMATKDALTGVYNRAYFIDAIKQKASESNRVDSSFSMILLDLDYFKQINDDYGHQKGDDVLKGTAELLKNNLRSSDVICRWGGEEFCVLMANTEYQKAITVAEKLRIALQNMKIEGVRMVTGSFGVTKWQQDDNEESVFKRLDNSLYLAKLTGRNKVVSNEELSIGYDSMPTIVEWGPFFRSGNIQIDTEHHRLISLSNEIISKCFSEDSYNETLHLFNLLITDTVLHFENEENALEEMNYSKLDEHRSIHKQLIEKTILMQQGLIDGRLTPIQVAKYVIQDVIIGHIVKSDFDYYRLFTK